jgi:hypothetical protein
MRRQYQLSYPEFRNWLHSSHLAFDRPFKASTGWASKKASLPRLNFRAQTRPSLERPGSGVYTFILGAGGANGALAQGEAPQRGAQPREYKMPAEQAPRGAADALP